MWAINLGLVAVWVMLNIGISSLSTNAMTVGKLNDPEPYPVFTFNTLSKDPRGNYREVISGIRDVLADNEIGPVYEIPRLSPRASVAKSRWFLQVKLVNSNEDNITCVLNTTNLYLAGYRTGNKFYYFPDTAEGVDTLFPNLPHYELPFPSSYGGLAKEAGDRSKIALGIAPLEQAIDDLQEYRRKDLARALTVAIQMFPEAIRFRYIQEFIGDIIRKQAQAVPSGTMMDLENEWGSLSTRIQNSIDGTINPPVVITNREGIKNSISTVTKGLVVNIGILFFVCSRTSNTELLQSSLHTDGGTFTSISEPILRNPVEKGAGDGATCNKIKEATVHIVGRNGLCAAVKDGTYNDGNPIILSQCKSNKDVNQLWTLKADGTIISNGMCLATYDSSPGVMVFNCKTTLPVSTKWEVWVHNGTIKSPKSSLVLSAASGSIGTELTLQENVYSTSETWVVANNTQPIITPIMNNGHFNMCIQANGNIPNQISYSGCRSGETSQIFAVYPDGSIRPNDERDDCLAVNNSKNLVVIAGCNGSSEQRWSFNRDYTISNLDTGLVMDALNNFIYLSVSSVPRGTQEWQAWLL